MGASTCKPTFTTDTDILHEHQTRVSRKDGNIYPSGYLSFDSLTHVHHPRSSNDESHPSQQYDTVQNKSYKTLRNKPPDLPFVSLTNMDFIATSSIDTAQPLPLLKESSSSYENLSKAMAVAEVTSSDFPQTYTTGSNSTHYTYSTCNDTDGKSVYNDDNISISSKATSHRSSLSMNSKRHISKRSSHLISRRTSTSWKKEDIEQVEYEMQSQLSFLKQRVPVLGILQQESEDEEQYESTDDYELYEQIEHATFVQKQIIDHQQKQIEELQLAVKRLIALQTIQLQ